MFYVIRRKGNHFNKKIFDSVFGEGAFNTFVKSGHIEKVSNGLAIGDNNTDYRQWVRDIDMYKDSGAMRTVNANDPGPYGYRDLENKGINVAMALCSGYVRMNTKGIYYDYGEGRPKVTTQNLEFDFSPQVICRKGNIYTPQIWGLIWGYTRENENIQVDEISGLVTGLVDDDLTKILSFENHSLAGAPYMILDQMYKGKIAHLEITKKNIPTVIELILSGHVLVKENYVYLDRCEIKEHKFYNWVGKNIFCR